MAKTKRGVAGKIDIKAAKNSLVKLPVVKDFNTGKEVAEATVQKLEDFCNAPAKGIASELFPQSGLPPGTLTIICSMPSQGKTAYLANVAMELARTGRCAAIFLPDGTQEEFVSKMLAIGSGLRYYKIMRGELPRQDWSRLAAAKEEIAGSGLYFSELRATHPQYIHEAADKLSGELKKAGRKLDAVIVDSLEYTADFESDRPLFWFRKIADELETSVICALKLRQNEKTEQGFVRLGDLREVGINEKETDLLLHLSRPEYYDRTDPTLTGKAAIWCLYSKDMRKHSAHLLFDHETLTFTKPSFIMDESLAVKKEKVF